MRTLIPTLVFLMLASYCHGQIERDKVLHFFGGGLFGLAGAGIAKHMSDGNRAWTFVGAVTGSAIAGVGKEILDSSQRDNGWDNGDLAATILGGVTVGVTIELFSKKDKEKRLRGQYSHVDFKEQKFESLPLDTEFVVYDGKLPSLSSFGIPQAILQTK